RLAGIITDGDLRRHMGDGLLAQAAGDVMTPNPITIQPAALGAEALKIMNAKRVTCLFVEEAGRPVGLVRLHDLLREGVACSAALWLSLRHWRAGGRSPMTRAAVG